jgi:hypothetical protein
MTELYVFRGTTGHAEMVTDDKSGKKLPSHPFGEWVFSRTINVVTGPALQVASAAGRSSQMSRRMGITIGRNWSLTSDRERTINAHWP